MKLTATVRVRPESSADRPSRARAENVAGLLHSRGFEVLHIGRFGISVRAKPEVFASEFHVHLDANKRFVAAVQAQNPRLAELVDSIEVAPAAESFG